MKIYKIGLMAVAALSLSSCNDFLQREPLDFGNESSYFKSDADLRLSANQFYTYLPKNGDLTGGLYMDDCTSDNQYRNIQNLFYEGQKQTDKVENSSWNFRNLREINFFIHKVEDAYDGIKGGKENIDNYLGEGYWFRAYEHFKLLKAFGDAPIVTQMYSDNADELTEASRRQPRNEVARQIIADLDRAAELLKETPMESGRVCKAAAYALKGRVALYEATWERYHAGTCFVPGNSKWVGAKMYPDFQFKAGSPEAEINWFLDQAIDASAKACDGRSLEPEYIKLFNRWASDFPNNDEVILARYYKSGIMGHSMSYYLKPGAGGGGCGITRAAVNTFLMASGLPIYADANYKGDNTSYLEIQGRDNRLRTSIRPATAGEVETKMGEDGKYYNDTIEAPYLPHISESDVNATATTGYEMLKWYVDDNADQLAQSSGTSAVPLIRVAECMLNYIEAYVERNGNVGGRVDEYWRALRNRAGVDPDYNKTIAATDLSKENDLAVWSKGKEVSKLLYNVRRERRCEMLAEGQRLDDLKRWRALDMMRNYQIEGFNLWAELYEEYEGDKLKPGMVSQAGTSTYIRPLQKSATSVVYDGYNFPKPHYLEPIPISQFLLTGGLDNSTIYQNPGWPSKANGIADYSYDCD